MTMIEDNRLEIGPVWKVVGRGDMPPYYLFFNDSQVRLSISYDSKQSLVDDLTRVLEEAKDLEKENNNETK